MDPSPSKLGYLRNVCAERFRKASFPEGYCKTDFDERMLTCWDGVPNGTVATQPCPRMELLESLLSEDSASSSFRECFQNGTWQEVGNYSKCSWLPSKFETTAVHGDDTDNQKRALAYLIAVCSVLSVIALCLTLFIFSYFKSLYCNRVKIHRNMCVALLLFLLPLLPPASSFLTKGHPLKSVESLNWLCISLRIVNMFSALSCCAWMFIEGLHLHNRLAVNVFQRSAPFKLYYLIGWGLPLGLTVSWGAATSQMSQEKCWNDYKLFLTVWLITGPQLFFLCVNAFFLINMLRILLTPRHPARNTQETDQIKKAVKATVLFFPLLGTPHLVAAVASVSKTFAYWVVTSLLWSTQGLAFGFLHCFTNADVQAVLKSTMRRLKARRSLNRSRCTASSAISHTTSTFLPSSSGNGSRTVNSRLVQGAKTFPFAERNGVCKKTQAEVNCEGQLPTAV